MYASPTLLPSRNPYEDYSAADYFGAEVTHKRSEGRRLARRAIDLFGRPGRLLELGCGQGEFLLAAREEGWQVAGVDMTESWAGRGAGVPVEVAPVEAAKSLDRIEAYDVIVLAAILEHLYDPVSCLQRCRTALAPGGLLFIDVPNECSLWTRAGNAYMRLRGRDWAINLSPTFPPFHVVGFCPRSLRVALGQAGFAVVELQTSRWQNELPAAGGMVARAERLGAGAVLTLGAALGMGAGITCWARKPAA